MACDEEEETVLQELPDEEGDEKSHSNSHLLEEIDTDTLLAEATVLMRVLIHTTTHKIMGQHKLHQYVKSTLNNENGRFYGLADTWVLHILDHRHVWMITKKDAERVVWQQIKKWSGFNLFRLYRAVQAVNDTLPEELHIDIDLHDANLDELNEEEHSTDEYN